MKEIDKYLQTLKQYAEKKLKGYFDINILNLNEFELINSFLIYQSMTKNKNLLIYLPNRQTKSQFYIPVIITLSLYEFINNYIDSENIYEIGDILQKNGIRYEIKDINGNNFVLQGPNSILTYPNYKQIKKNYIITTASKTDRKSKTKFNSYKDFFTKSLKLNDKEGLPSKFKYKSVIVTDKKIVEELKKYEIENKKIHKAFPFRYLTSNGKATDNIPIDPMIYIVNNYETVKEHLINKGVKINNIIFIGKNKYQDIELNLSTDYNNGLFENTIFIGSRDIQENSIPNLLKWKWTLPELKHFNYFDTGKIEIITISDQGLEEKIESFNELVKSIENEYNLNLSKIYYFVRKVFPITVPNENSRLIKQLDYLLDVFSKDIEEYIESEFYEIDEYDYEEVWNKIYENFKKIIGYKKTDNKKFEKLKSLEKIDYLVVPKDYINIWKEETNIKKVISFREFKELKSENKFKKNKIIVFLGFYGYEHLKELLYNNFNITLLLNHIEKQSYDHYNTRLENETMQKMNDKDRKVLSDISFTQTKSDETVSELLKRLFDKNNTTKENEEYEYEYSNINDNSLDYKFVLDNYETIVLDENKTVLLQTKNGERPEKVKNIKAGDKIRIYENTTKEKLYKIALEADSEGHFKEIEEASKIWKTALRELSKNFSSISEFLKYLKENGITITNETTLRKWINTESNVKFPQKIKDLKVIRKVCNNKALNENFSKILAARSSYNGIMIALGRDLSDDVAQYIQTKKKGKILEKFSDEQIKEMINHNAPLHTVKSIKLANDEN